MGNILEMEGFNGNISINIEKMSDFPAMLIQPEGNSSPTGLGPAGLGYYQGELAILVYKC